MCLVTGCEKTRYWASAFYMNHNADIDMMVSGDSQVFRRNDAFQGNVRSHQEGEDDSKDTTVDRHCLAFRAFHISLKPSLFLDLPYVKKMYEKPSNRFSFLPPAFQPPVKSYEQRFPVCHRTVICPRLLSVFFRLSILR